MGTLGALGLLRCKPCVADAADGGLPTFGQLGTAPALWAEARNGVFQEATGTPVTPSLVGNVVGSLIDLSGNARTLQSGTTARRGILRARAGGAAVEMDGTDDNYRVAFALAQPFTRVTCINQITWTVNDVILDGAINFTYYTYLGGSSPTIISRSGSVLLTLAPPALGTPFVITEVFDGANSRARINKGAWVTGNMSALAAGGLSVGARGDGVSGASNIDFYGGAVFAAALSNDDLDAATTYAGSLAGLSI